MTTDATTRHEERDQTDEQGNAEPDDIERSTFEQDPPPTWVEWSARLTSLGLVLLLLGYVVFAGLQQSAPPRFDMTVHHDRIAERAGSWVVPVEIANAGDTSVEVLEVRLELVNAEGGLVESESVVVPLLGRRAAFEAEFWLATDPRPHALRLDVGGYVVP